jgi:hypothetical protein
MDQKSHDESLLTTALARYIDEYQGDYPLIILEDEGARVIAVYKNTELNIAIRPDKPNGVRRGSHPADLYARSVADAIGLISRIESVRQGVRHPMLRF